MKSEIQFTSIADIIAYRASLQEKRFRAELQAAAEAKRKAKEEVRRKEEEKRKAAEEKKRLEAEAKMKALEEKLDHLEKVALTDNADKKEVKNCLKTISEKELNDAQKQRLNTIVFTRAKQDCENFIQAEDLDNAASELKTLEALDLLPQQKEALAPIKENYERKKQIAIQKAEEEKKRIAAEEEAERKRIEAEKAALEKKLAAELKVATAELEKTKAEYDAVSADLKKMQSSSEKIAKELTANKKGLEDIKKEAKKYENPCDVYLTEMPKNGLFRKKGDAFDEVLKQLATKEIPVTSANIEKWRTTLKSADKVFVWRCDFQKVAHDRPLIEAAEGEMTVKCLCKKEEWAGILKKFETEKTQIGNKIAAATKEQADIKAKIKTCESKVSLLKTTVNKAEAVVKGINEKIHAVALPQKEFETAQEFCKKHEGCEIIEIDGSVYVNGNSDVEIRCNELIKGHFPVRFYKVKGSFRCNCSKLTSLQGAPQEVEGNFNCSSCKNLTSLQGAPQEVGGRFCCDFCEKLTSLQGAPQKVGGDFDCSYCNLKNTNGRPSQIGGKFWDKGWGGL